MSDSVLPASVGEFLSLRPTGEVSQGLAGDSYPVGEVSMGDVVLSPSSDSVSIVLSDDLAVRLDFSSDSVRVWIDHRTCEVLLKSVHVGSGGECSFQSLVKPR